jgi:hypothetical protein
LRTWSDPAALVAASAQRRRPLARVGLATVAVLALPAALLTMWPESDPAAPPLVVATPSASPSASLPSPPPVLPTASPFAAASASPVRRPTRSPSPRASQPATPSVPQQIASLQAVVRNLADTGQLPRKNADELVHLLDDLERQIAEGKRKEAGDKLAAIRKKNDDLLRDGKISSGGHEEIEARLIPLSVAVSEMPVAGPQPPG